MLIDKGVTDGDIVSLKVINGDELIAKFVSEDATTITINRPKALTAGPQGLGMIPWLFLGGKDTVTLQKSHVFVMVPSNGDASKQYLEGTTGIALS
jgi:hypothetical protein